MAKPELDLTGVEIRGGNIRITFTWRGQRCREALNLPPTAANLRYAVRFRHEVQNRIGAGVFDYVKEFPHSQRAKRLGLVPGSARIPTFRELAQRWLAARTLLARSTVRSYRVALESFWYPAIGDTVITAIRYSDLMTALAARDWGSGKTQNNYLIPLRSVLDLAFVDGMIERNPGDRLRNARVQKPEPDPFTLDEVELVIAELCKRYTGPYEQAANYFEFAFFSGMRPSELIALKWSDIDWQGEHVRVCRARVEGEEKPTKTHRVRHVDLNRRSLAALRRQKAHTFLGSEYVFHNPATGKPWADDYRQRKTYWAPTLKLLGMRQRDAYQTRHTYATLLLMNGLNPAYIAKQLGHTTMKMLLERYARWIPGADGGREKAKIDAAISRTASTAQNKRRR